MTTEQQIPTDAIKVNSNLATEELNEEVDDEKLSMDTTEDEIIENEATSTISSNDLTTNTENIVEFATEITDEAISNNKVEENQNKVPESLLSAVGDLLSSVLGINFTDFDDDDDDEKDGTNSENDSIVTTAAVPEQEILDEEEQSATTENTVTSRNADEMAVADDDNLTSEIAPALNEVDLKIENLSNVPTSFMTENTPEVYTERAVETVKEQSTEDISSDVKNVYDDDKIVLETLSELTTIENDDDNDGEEQKNNLVSIEDSVNHVMNLVRGTEGILALKAAQNIINHQMDDSASDLDQIVYGTLKEIESNLDMDEADKNLPIDSFDPVDHEREELIKNFELDINESLRRRTNPDDEDYDILDLEPNPVKAAMYYKFQYGEDF